MQQAGVYDTVDGLPRYVYTLEPATVGDHKIPVVRLTYFDDKNGNNEPDEGEVIDDDQIEMTAAAAHDEFKMTINPGALDQRKILATFTVDGESLDCSVAIGTGTLTVKSVVNDESVTNAIEDDKNSLDGDKLTAVAEDNVTYYVNDTEVEVSANRVQLLTDAVSNDGDFNQRMGQHAVETVDGGDGRELVYMDLVDSQNGNAEVTLGDGNSLTIYWPMPDGADAADTFKVVHYTEMDRESVVPDWANIEPEIINAQYENVNGNDYVTFEVDSFSPFALVWTKADEPVPVEKHDVIFNAGVHGSFNGSDADVTVQIDENSKLTNSQIPNVTADHNWKFVGWTGSDGKTYTNAQLLELTITEDITFTAQYESTYTPPPYDPGEPDPEPDEPDTPDVPEDPETNVPSDLNTVDHDAYVYGYEDGTVMPQKQITRAEVATIFYRLLKEDVRDENTTDVSDFSDVKSSDWYGTTVATLAEMNILKGYEDGTFRPNAPITRAEFAAIATRFFDETGATYEPGTFTDVTGSEWFAGAIMDAVNLGLIGGYEDGTVRPNNNITRAEACAIVNRTLGRVPDADHLLPEDEMKTWPDNPESAWFYADMQEATNGHEYEWITDDGNKVENWTDLLDKDWNDR